MHISTLRPAVRGVVLTGVALGLSAGLATSASGSTSIQVAERGSAASGTTTHERGVVLECRGKAQGLTAYVSVYENNRFGNYLQVVLGEGDDAVHRGRKVNKNLVRKGHLTQAARVAVDGSPAKIKGTAYAHGPTSRVHEEMDDAGYHVTIDGTNRQMVTDMGLVHDGKRVGLTCDPGFRFNLKTVKEPIT